MSTSRCTSTTQLWISCKDYLGEGADIKLKPSNIHPVFSGLVDGQAVFEAQDRAQEPARFVFEGDAAGTTLTVRVESLDAEGEVRESFEAHYTRRTGER